MIPVQFKQIIHAALTEDAVTKDITSSLTIPKQLTCQAKILSKQPLTLAGTKIAQYVFQKVDPKCKVSINVQDGKRIATNRTVINVKGSMQKILAAERTALNFLGHLSGIASLTHDFVKQAGGRVKIFDTRKTTPGLRCMEKYAVKMGGGHNHRFDLSEMIFIKDNHLKLINTELTITQLVKKVRQKSSKRIIIEVDTISQLNEVLPLNPYIILLDNFSIPNLKKAVSIAKTYGRRPLLEASGGVTLKKVRSMAQTGIDRISIGAITHSAPQSDFSMEIL